MGDDGGVFLEAAHEHVGQFVAGAGGEFAQEQVVAVRLWADGVNWALSRKPAAATSALLCRGGLREICSRAGAALQKRVFAQNAPDAADDLRVC